MAKALLLVMTNAKDAAQEADFNEWYDNVHLEDVLMTPGIKKATRYELAGRPREGRGKYLALYEIETDDPSASAIWAKLNETMDQRKAAGRVVEHPALELVTSAIYVQRGEPQLAKD